MLAISSLLCKDSVAQDSPQRDEISLPCLFDPPTPESWTPTREGSGKLELGLILDGDKVTLTGLASVGAYLGSHG